MTEGGFAGFLAAIRPGPDEQARTLEQVLTGHGIRRSDQEPDPVDLDDKIANMMTRGVVPGGTFKLAQQIADVEAEIESENEKIDRYQRHAEHVARMHQNGQIQALDIPRMLGDDEGDVDRVARLERRRDRLQAQQATQQAAMSPPQAQRSQDPLEAATARAHAAFVETTRAMFADVQAGRGPAARSTPERRRPFDGDGAGDDDTLARVITRSGAGCRHCAEMGVTAREAAYIHRAVS